MRAKAGWCYRADKPNKLIYVIDLEMEGYKNLVTNQYTRYKYWDGREREAVAPKELMFWTE